MLDDVRIAVGTTIAARLPWFSARELLQAGKHVQGLIQLPAALPLEHLRPLFEVVDLGILDPEAKGNEARTRILGDWG